MRRAAVGTIAVHGLVAIAFVAIGRTDEVRLPSARTIELVDLASVDTPAPPSSAATGGGVAGAPSPTPEPATTSGPRRVVTRSVMAHATAHAPERTTDDVASILGPASSEGDSDGDGRGGSGGGTGSGRGLGSGPAIGTHALQVDAPAPPPAPPKISKARPPRLIFPARSRDSTGDGDRPFVASVLVDEHGDVAGARLIELRHTPADTVAESLIFRFRYEPALDDDGHPISARIDQPFLVE